MYLAVFPSTSFITVYLHDGLLLLARVILCIKILHAHSNVLHHEFVPLCHEVCVNLIPC